MTLICLKFCANLVDNSNLKFIVGKGFVKKISIFGRKRLGLVFVTGSLRSYSDYYNTLGVSRTANISSIKKAYYTKCKQFHPDRIDIASGENKKEFLKVQTAYQALKSIESRKQYDTYLQSIEKSQYDFTEWKSHKMETYTGERDYTKYRTTPPASQGVNAKWSDFTWKDYAAFLFVAFSGVYIVNSEIKARKVRHRKYYYTQVDSKLSKSKVHLKRTSSEIVSNNDSVEHTTNIEATEGSLNSKKETKMSKKIKLLHKKHNTKKRKTDLFQEIKSTGSVSDTVMENLETSATAPASQKPINLTTW